MMSDQSDTTNSVVDGGDAGTEESKQSGLSKSDVEESEKFKAVKRQLVELQLKETQREELESKAAREKAIAEAEKDKEYDTALSLLREEAKRDKDALLSTQLKYELSLKGFEQRGIDLLSSEYTSEAGSIAEYAKACLENEANKVFLSSPDKRKLVNEPNPAIVAGGGGMTDELCREYEKSTDPDKVKQARDYILAKFKRGEKLP